VDDIDHDEPAHGKWQYGYLIAGRADGSGEDTARMDDLGHPLVLPDSASAVITRFR
jgi:hypothetical protein